MSATIATITRSTSKSCEVSRCPSWRRPRRLKDRRAPPTRDIAPSPAAVGARPGIDHTRGRYSAPAGGSSGDGATSCGVVSLTRHRDPLRHPHQTRWLMPCCP
jgi:hypothetical protein